MKATRLLFFFVILLMVIQSGFALGQDGPSKKQLRKQLMKKVDRKLKQERAFLLKEVNQRLQKSKATRPAPAPSQGKAYMGINAESLGEEIASVLGLKAGEGLLITNVVDGSPADSAGLKINDILLSVNGDDVETLQWLVQWVQSQKPRSKHGLGIMRKMQTKTLHITLGAVGGAPQDDNDDSDDDALRQRILKDIEDRLAREREILLKDIEEMLDREFAKKNNANSKPYLGARMATLGEETAAILGLPEGHGLKVTQVEPKGPADKAGLKILDIVLAVDGEAMRGLDAFKVKYKNFKPGETHSFSILRRMKKQNLDITIGRAKTKGKGKGKGKGKKKKDQPLRGSAFTKSATLAWKELHKLNFDLRSQLDSLTADQLEAATDSFRELSRQRKISNNMFEALMELSEAIPTLTEENFIGFMTATVRVSPKGQLLYNGAEGVGMDPLVVQNAMNFIFLMKEEAITIRPGYRTLLRQMITMAREAGVESGQRKVLGVYIADLSEDEFEQTQGGVKIIDIIPDTPAEKAGLRKGDILVKWGKDNTIIEHQKHLRELIKDSEFDSNIPIQVLGADGKRRTLYLKFVMGGISTQEPATLAKAQAPRPEPATQGCLAQPPAQDLGDSKNAALRNLESKDLALLSRIDEKLNIKTKHDPELDQLAARIKRRLRPVEQRETHAAPPAPRRIGDDKKDPIVRKVIQLDTILIDEDDFMLEEDEMEALLKKLGHLKMELKQAPDPRFSSEKISRHTKKTKKQKKQKKQQQKNKKKNDDMLEIIIKHNGKVVLQIKANTEFLAGLRDKLHGAKGSKGSGCPFSGPSGQWKEYLKKALHENFDGAKLREALPHRDQIRKALHKQLQGLDHMRKGSSVKKEKLQKKLRALQEQLQQLREMKESIQRRK